MNLFPKPGPPTFSGACTSEIPVSSGAERAERTGLERHETRERPSSGLEDGTDR